MTFVQHHACMSCCSTVVLSLTTCHETNKTVADVQASLDYSPRQAAAHCCSLQRRPTMTPPMTVITSP